MRAIWPISATVLGGLVFFAVPVRAETMPIPPPPPISSPFPQGAPPMIPPTDTLGIECMQGNASACAQRQVEIANGSYVAPGLSPSTGAQLAPNDPHSVGVAIYDNAVTSKFVQDMQANLAGLSATSPAAAPVVTQLQQILSTLQNYGGNVAQALASGGLKQQAQQLFAVAQPYLSSTGASSGSSLIPGLQAALPGLAAQVLNGQLSPGQAISALNAQGGGTFLQNLLGGLQAGAATSGGSGTTPLSMLSGAGGVSPAGGTGYPGGPSGSQGDSLGAPFQVNQNLLSGLLNSANSGYVP